MKRVLVTLLLIIPAAITAAFVFGPRLIEQRMNRVLSSPLPSLSTGARDLHRNLVVADLHADLLMWDRDPLERAGYGHTDVPRLIEGNVALQVFSVVTKVPSGLNYESNPADSDSITALALLQRWPMVTWRSLRERALHQAGKLHAAAHRSGGRLSLITSTSELEGYLKRRQAEPGITAGLLAIEGLQALEGELANVDALHAAGFRMMGLTHFFDNEVAGSAHGTERGGLTDLGRRVIRRMEELRVIIDLAHASPQTVDEVLEMATRPVAVSHTGVQGTCPGPRNLSDAHVRRVAKNGGVIGIGYWDGAICEPTPAGFARAVRYTADLAGIDHVALGSDFDGATETPFDTTGLAHLTAALQSEGFSDDEIRKLMGGNVVRFLSQTLPVE